MARKAPVEIAGRRYLAYMFDDKSVPMSFDKASVEDILDTLNVEYTFEEIEEEGMFRRKYNSTCLVISPDSENERRVISPSSTIDSSTRYGVTVYLLDLPAIAGCDAPVFVDSAPLDIVNFAAHAAADMTSHMEAVIDSYLEQLDSVGPNAKELFCEALKWMSGQPGNVSCVQDIANKRAHAATENMIWCSECCEYRPKDAFHEEKREEEREEQTYTDAGWGDDDMFGIVRRLNTYRICDACGHEVKIDSMWLSTRDEISRSEARSRRRG